MDHRKYILLAIGTVGTLIIISAYFKTRFIANPPHFISKQDTIALIKDDPDGFFGSLSELDLYARKSSSINDYIARSTFAAHELTREEQKILTKAAKEADAYFYSLNLPHIGEIPWLFAATNGEYYEGGLPHTRQNVIFLTPDIIHSKQLLRTLVHEKVHVHQKISKPDIKGYKRVMLRNQYRKGYNHRVRANPDLDEWIYADRSLMYAEYTSDFPSSIQDIVQSNPAFEHPYEKEAYEIANRI